MEAEESPRVQKKASPTLSSGSASSPPLFSATATSPMTPGQFPALPQLDLALLAMHSADSSNYTTLAMAPPPPSNSPTTLEAMQEMDLPRESVEDHIRSMTPVKFTAEVAFDTDVDMLRFTPPTTDSPPAPTESEKLATKYERMSEIERKTKFRDLFKDGEVELQKLQTPALCAMIPKYADEVLQAYLTHTRFVIKIWANYDSVKKQFYLRPAQLADCGKMDLFPSHYARLEKLNPRIYQLKKVCLNIGTPFRNLFTLKIDCVRSENSRSGWRLRAAGCEEVPDGNAPHYILADGVEKAWKKIKKDGITGRQHGLTFSDLEEIALEFRYEPKDQGEFMQLYSKPF